jgi:hypothetical protein
MLLFSTQTTPGVTEADIIRWVGVAVSVVGAFIAAPSGTWLILSEIGEMVLWAMRQLRARLANWLPSCESLYRFMYTPALVHSARTRPLVQRSFERGTPTELWKQSSRSYEGRSQICARTYKSTRSNWQHGARTSPSGLTPSTPSSRRP